MSQNKKCNYSSSSSEIAVASNLHLFFRISAFPRHYWKVYIKLSLQSAIIPSSSRIQNINEGSFSQCPLMQKLYRYKFIRTPQKFLPCLLPLVPFIFPVFFPFTVNMQLKYWQIMHLKIPRATQFFQILSQPDHKCPERCELIGWVSIQKI